MRAASATPCAWLPAEEHTTPRRALVVGERHELVQRAANLVRPRALEHLRLEADVVVRCARSASATTAAACDACAAQHARAPPRTRRARAAAWRRSFRGTSRGHHDLDQPVRRHEAGLHRRARGKIALEERDGRRRSSPRSSSCRSGRRRASTTSAGEQPAAVERAAMRVSVSRVCAPTSPFVSGVLPSMPGHVDAVAGPDRRAEVRVRGPAVVDHALRRRPRRRA